MILSERPHLVERFEDAVVLTPLRVIRPLTWPEVVDARRARDRGSGTTPAKPIVPIIRNIGWQVFARTFWSRVDRDGSDDCWIWTGARNEHGYGQLCVGGVPLKAHRIAYVLHSGHDPDPLLRVCHSCDNPRCCNPDHLWIGSQADNIRDARDKGRMYARRVAA